MPQDFQRHIGETRVLNGMRIRSFAIECMTLISAKGSYVESATVLYFTGEYPNRMSFADWMQLPLDEELGNPNKE